MAQNLSLCIQSVIFFLQLSALWDRQWRMLVDGKSFSFLSWMEMTMYYLRGFAGACGTRAVFLGQCNWVPLCANRGQFLILFRVCSFHSENIKHLQRYSFTDEQSSSQVEASCHGAILASAFYMTSFKFTEALGSSYSEQELRTGMLISGCS